jgi:hypothetical protein
MPQDPYAPTSVARIIERQQQKQQPQQQQARAPIIPQRSPTTYTTSTPSQSVSSQPSTSSSAATVPIANDRAAKERELKKQKEKFIMFTRVLLKYLESKDSALHLRVKAIIQECAERNKRQERGYESITASMKLRLKEVVGESYWKRAEQYLHHFLAQKAKQQQQQQQQQQTTDANAQDAVARKKADLERQRLLQMRQQQQQKLPPSQQQQPQQQVPRPTGINTQRPGPSSGTQASAATTATITKHPPSKSTTQEQLAAAKAGKTATVEAKTAAARGAKSFLPAQRKDNKPDEQQQRQPREYNELMEMVDHAVTFDWTTAGLMMGQELHAQLSEEQNNVLYSRDNNNFIQIDAPVGQAFPVRGWGRRNVVSARAVWAKVRLPEMAESSGLSVANGFVCLPEPGAYSRSAPLQRTGLNTWHNEDVAEDDVVLATLSQGAEIFLRSILEKAVYCARQRQNVDGIRLWHQQLVPSKTSAFTLRLGCDVSRQVARTAGNAALTVKRMEEALERQEGVPTRARVLNNETLASAHSMSDLALRPKLLNGAKDAEYAAKRSFEVYGGRDASEPVFGRVPKQARLEVVDFQMAMSFTGIGRRQKAETLSGSFAF